MVVMGFLLCLLLQEMQIPSDQNIRILWAFEAHKRIIFSLLERKLSHVEGVEYELRWEDPGQAVVLSVLAGWNALTTVSLDDHRMSVSGQALLQACLLSVGSVMTSCIQAQAIFLPSPFDFTGW